MKAIQFSEFGGPEVLREADVEIPAPGPGQVRVQVKTAAVNPLDGKIRAGFMEAAFPTPLPAVPGAELAGIVDALGEGVTGLAVGDEVFGWADTGAYAEYALASQVVRKPAALSWEAAVALPVAGDTASRALLSIGVAKGETVLIHGAAGAVGTIAVQLAVALGATVIGTASPANQDYVRSLGAIATEYGDGLVERVRALAPQGVDAVLDAAGKGALPDSIELLGGTARIVTIADMAAQSLGVAFNAGNPAERSLSALAELAEQAARGEVVTAISATYPLADAVAAQTRVDEGHARGKVVLTVS